MIRLIIGLICSQLLFIARCEKEVQIKHPHSSSSKSNDYEPANLLKQSNGWLSAQLEEHDQPEYLYFALSRPSFVHRIEVIWIQSAQKYVVTGWNDNIETKLFLSQIVQYNSTKQQQQLIFKNFYIDEIKVDNDWMIKNMNISMLESVYDNYGISGINVYSQSYTVLLVSLDSKSNDISYLENCLYWQQGFKIDECIKQFSKANFVFTQDNQLMFDDLCFQADIEKQYMQLVLGDCLAEESINIDEELQEIEKKLYRIENDSREILIQQLSKEQKEQILARSQYFQWSDNYQLSLIHNPNICIYMRQDELYLDPGNVVSISSNSTFKDGEHGINNVLNSNVNQYWSSEMDVHKTVEIRIKFDKAVLIKAIEIYFTYVAEQFEVQIMKQNNKYETVYKTSINQDYENNILINQQTESVVILLNKAHDVLGVYLEKYQIYGVRQLNFISQQNEIGYRECRFNNSRYSSNLNYVQQLNQEKVFIQQLSPYEPSFQQSNSNGFDDHELQNNMKKLWNSQEADEQIGQVEQTIEKQGQGIKEMEGQINYINYELNKLHKSLHQNDSNSNKVQQTIYYHDCSQIEPKISDTYKIRNLCIQNGQFINVYCDFSLNPEGLSYYILENVYDRLIFAQNNVFNLLLEKNPIILELLCSYYGLEPIKINNTLEHNHLVDYLKNYNESGQYVFQNKVFKDGQLTDDFYDLILADKKNELKLVCSNNLNSAKPRNVLELDCYQNAVNVRQIVQKRNPYSDIQYVHQQRTQIEKNIQQYENIFIKCKQNCANKKQFQVIGNIVYKDTSSICRAALHSGFLNVSNYNQVLELYFKQQVAKYEGSFQNGIQSEQYQMSMDSYSAELKDNSFSFIFSPIIQYCKYDGLVHRINSIFEDRQRKDNCKQSFIETSEESSFRTDMIIDNEQIDKIVKVQFKQQYQNQQKQQTELLGLSHSLKEQCNGVMQVQQKSKEKMMFQNSQLQDIQNQQQQLANLIQTVKQLQKQSQKQSDLKQQQQLQKLKKYKYYTDYFEKFDLGMGLDENYKIYEPNNKRVGNYIYKETRLTNIYNEISRVIAQNQEIVAKKADYVSSMMILHSRAYTDYVYNIEIVQDCYYCNFAIMLQFQNENNYIALQVEVEKDASKQQYMKIMKNKDNQLQLLKYRKIKEPLVQGDRFNFTIQKYKQEYQIIVNRNEYQFFDLDFLEGQLGIGFINCQDIYVVGLNVQNIKFDQKWYVNAQQIQNRMQRNNRQKCQIYREYFDDIYNKYRLVEEKVKKSEFIQVNKYMNRSSVIMQESREDRQNSQGIFLLKEVECYGYEFRNYMNIEIDIYMNKMGKTGVVFRYFHQNIYYLKFVVYFVSSSESYFQLYKVYYNNQILIESKPNRDQFLLQKWNRVFITLNGQFVQIIVLNQKRQNQPTMIFQKMIKEDPILHFQSTIINNKTNYVEFVKKENILGEEELEIQDYLTDDIIGYQIGLVANYQSAFSRVLVIPHKIEQTEKQKKTVAEDMCYNRGQQARSEYCQQEQYFETQEIKEHCINNFCQICCQKQINDDTNKVKLYNCEKQCSKTG